MNDARTSIGVRLHAVPSEGGDVEPYGFHERPLRIRKHELNDRGRFLWIEIHGPLDDLNVDLANELGAQIAGAESTFPRVPLPSGTSDGAPSELVLALSVDSLGLLSRWPATVPEVLLSDLDALRRRWDRQRWRQPDPAPGGFALALVGVVLAAHLAPLRSPDGPQPSIQDVDRVLEAFQQVREQLARPEVGIDERWLAVRDELTRAIGEFYDVLRDRKQTVRGRLAEERVEAERRFGNIVAWVTTLVLGPTLVAAITEQTPGLNGENWGAFLAMLVLMLASGLLLHRVLLQRAGTRARPPGQGRFRAAVAALLGTGWLIVAVAAAVGVILVCNSEGWLGS